MLLAPDIALPTKFYDFHTRDVQFFADSHTFPWKFQESSRFSTLALGTLTTDSKRWKVSLAKLLFHGYW